MTSHSTSHTLEWATILSWLGEGEGQMDQQQQEDHGGAGAALIFYLKIIIFLYLDPDMLIQMTLILYFARFDFPL